MAKEIEINLSDYIAVQPQSIIKRNGVREMYDLVLEKDHTFFVKIGSEYMLTHNCDGSHISALLMNFFNKWFPWLIEEGKVYLLNTPIITAKINNTLTHFYNKEDFYNKKYKNVKDKTYIKGLGSLDEHDWKLIFNEMRLFKITVDDQSSTLLNIAFSDDPSLRRKWLENKLTKKQ